MSETLPQPTRRKPSHWDRTLRLPLLLLVQAVAIYFFASLLSSDLGSHNADLSRYVIYSQRVWTGQWPYVDFDMEYPIGSLLPMMIAGSAAREQSNIDVAIRQILPPLFAEVAVLCCITTLILWRLNRHEPARQWTAAVRFAVLTVVMTPIAAFRYDTAPMAATAGAVLALAAGIYPTCGALIGFGILLKLYPAVLIPIAVLVLAVRRRWRAIVNVLLGVAVVVAAPFVIFAFKSPLAPLKFLQYQTERGMQIETTWAGLALLARNYLHVPTKMVAVYGALEVKSTLVTTFLTIQHYLLPTACLASLAYCGWIALRLRARAADWGQIITQMFALLMMVVLLLSKVFSTQYIVWLLPFCVSGSRLRFGLILVIGVVTLYIFPFGLTDYARMSLGKVMALNLRSLLLVVLAIESAVSLWKTAETLRGIKSAATDQPSDASSASAAAS